MTVLGRSFARRYGRTVLACWAAVVVVFLVADFGDRVKAFLDRPLADVGALYWNKALVAVHQLGPVALLLASGLFVSRLRRQGELQGAFALGASPRVVLAPIAAIGCVAAMGLVVFDELVASRAGEQIDRIQVERFGSWGDFRFHFGHRQWYRADPWIVQLRGEGGTDVTLYRLGPGFHLERRIDAEAMRSLGGSRWHLSGVSERDFAGEGRFTRLGELELELPGTQAGTFFLREGRPEQLTLAEMTAQKEARERVGRPGRPYVFAWHQRFTFPLSGLLAAVLGALLAMRRDRSPKATSALVEGLSVVAALWGVMVVSRTLVLAGHLPAALGSWSPPLVLVAMSAWVARREGWLGYGSSLSARR